MYYCLAPGLRNGDRPGDARVTALLATGTQPDERRPPIVVTMRNPWGTPVIAALSAAVGQEDGRLRVHRLRLGPVSYAADGRQMIMVE